MHNIMEDIQETFYDWSRGNVMFKRIQDFNVEGEDLAGESFVYDRIVLSTPC